MRWRTKWISAIAALAAALLVLSDAGAQPPTGKKDAKEPTKAPPTRPAAPAKPDPAVEAWVKILGDKMTDRHDTVRDSARAALVSIGKPALPSLQKLADSDDGATATAAKRVMARIESHDRRRPPPRFGRGPIGPLGPGMRGGPGGRPPPMAGGGRGHPGVPPGRGRVLGRAVQPGRAGGVGGGIGAGGGGVQPR